MQVSHRMSQMKGLSTGDDDSHERWMELVKDRLTPEKWHARQIMKVET